jgi:hypothetical protein
VEHHALIFFLHCSYLLVCGVPLLWRANAVGSMTLAKCCVNIISLMQENPE